MKLANGTGERSRQADLEALAAALKARRYRFVPPTPATHARVLARDPHRLARNLEDMLGWSRPFRSEAVDPEVEALLTRAGAVAQGADGLKSLLRAATLQGELYLHSAYPTTSQDSVFLGPDSYRFARLILAELERSPCASGATVLDIGTGAGVGGIVAASRIAGAHVVLTDINAAALQLAHANAAGAGIAVETRLGASLAGFADPIDLALANPPYIMDGEGRTYRDGGDRHGAALSIEMAAATLPWLAGRGRLILYTGSAIVGGEDRLAPALFALAARHRCALDYAELDPDVFGEELDRPAYADVDRIAVISAIFTRDEED